jgi:Pyruvate/2-oxoacid:ferredoxin oxidoreductase gamma subunit
MSVVVLILFEEKYLSGCISFKLVESEIKTCFKYNEVDEFMANYVRGRRFFFLTQQMKYSSKVTVTHYTVFDRDFTIAAYVSYVAVWICFDPQTTFQKKKNWIFPRIVKFMNRKVLFEREFKLMIKFLSESSYLRVF